MAATFAVGMAAVMSGCGGCMGCNSCSSCGGSTSSGALVHSNWFTGTSYNGIQPSFIVENPDGIDVNDSATYQNAEVITYTVEYDKKSSNENVELEYRDGKFSTVFCAFEYDWSKEGTPEGYAGSKPEILYYYRTELSIDVKYKMLVGDKRESDWFEDDGVVTESYFRAVGKNLQPVYSRQTVKSTSPAELRPTTLTAAYKIIDESYENFYNYSCTRVLTKTTKDNKTTEKTHKVGNYVYDNSSLYILARAMLSSSLSQTVSLYSPAAGGTDKYALTGSNSNLPSDENNDERKKCTDALTAQGLYKSSGEDDKGVTTTAVSVSYAGGDLHGTSQTIWYASLSNNKDNNLSRATMVKLSVPISFGLGTLNYNLDEIKSTLI